MSARRQFVKPSTPPNSEINVTPLVDVVLVLLIIFMVLTPLLEKDIEVRIPETEEVPRLRTTRPTPSSSSRWTPRGPTPSTPSP
ncbi:biopolymer transporter ExbD [Cystobacter fuscus]